MCSKFNVAVGASGVPALKDGEACYSSIECVSNDCRKNTPAAGAAANTVTDATFCQAKAAYVDPKTTVKLDVCSDVDTIISTATRMPPLGTCATSNDCEQGTCEKASGPVGICINSIQHNTASEIESIATSSRVEGMANCFSWQSFEISSPFVGAFFAFFMMYNCIHQYAFGMCQWRAKHPGFFLLFLLATAWVAYNINMVYNKMFYDNFMKLVDCSASGTIHLAHAQTQVLLAAGKVCYAYNPQIPLEQLTTVFGINAHADLNAKMFMYLFVTFNSGIILAWLSIALSLVALFGSPFLQIKDCECGTCTGASFESAKKKGDGAKTGATAKVADVVPGGEPAGEPAGGPVGVSEHV